MRRRWHYYLIYCLLQWVDVRSRIGWFNALMCKEGAYIDGVDAHLYRMKRGVVECLVAKLGWGGEWRQMPWWRSRGTMLRTKVATTRAENAELAAPGETRIRWSNIPLTNARAIWRRNGVTLRRRCLVSACHGARRRSRNIRLGRSESVTRCKW